MRLPPDGVHLSAPDRCRYKREKKRGFSWAFPWAGLSQCSDVLDKLMSQLADTHAEYATEFAQAKEEVDQEITALRKELIHACQEPAMLRAIDASNGSGRGPNDGLN
jgi:hypothetical protein